MVANPYYEINSSDGKKGGKRCPRTYASKDDYDRLMGEAPATKMKTLIEVLEYHLGDDNVPPVTVDPITQELQFGQRPEGTEPSQKRKILVFMAWTLMTQAFKTVSQNTNFYLACLMFLFILCRHALQTI